jgi:hypothetical protein
VLLSRCWFGDKCTGILHCTVFQHFYIGLNQCVTAWFCYGSGSGSVKEKWLGFDSWIYSAEFKTWCILIRLWLQQWNYTAPASQHYLITHVFLVQNWESKLFAILNWHGFPIARDLKDLTWWVLLKLDPPQALDWRAYGPKCLPPPPPQGRAVKYRDDSTNVALPFSSWLFL